MYVSVIERRKKSLVKVVAAMAGIATLTGLLAGCGGTTTAKAEPAGPPQHPASLVGVVGHGDAFSISLSDPTGHAIRNLAAGTYSITLKDESTIHNFHLTGAGVDKATSVGSTSSTTFSVTFKPGTYTFVCDPHSSQMRGSFRVT